MYQSLLEPTLPAGSPSLALAILSYLTRVSLLCAAASLRSLCKLITSAVTAALRAVGVRANLGVRARNKLKL